MDKIKAQKTTHIEGNIDIEGAGLKGSFVQWSEIPIKSRQSVDLKILKQTSGDNGQFSWGVDHNGKLQIARDEKSLKERQVALLMAEYDHLNRDSKNFKITFEGIDTAAGAPCYMVKIANNINEDIIINYYDTLSFYLMKAASKQPDREIKVVFSDYRPVNGVLYAFTQRSILESIGQIINTKFTLIETNIPIDTTLFEPPPQDVSDFRFADGKSAENIPFQFIDNHIYLYVTVNGRSRLWILESGAGNTVLDSKYAAELGIKTEGNIKGQGAGNLVDVSFAVLPQFNIDGLEFDSQKVAVIDISRLIKKWVGFNVGGILGYDFLSRLVTRIDYANERISFYHPDSFNYDGSGTILSAPVSQNNMFHLPLTVDGKYGGLWNLDLGAGETSFHYPFAETNGFLNHSGIDCLGFGAGGSFKERKTQFQKIEFGGFTVEKPVITWGLEATKGAFGGKELAGNIGNSLLRNFILYLDYKKERVIVEKGTDFGKALPLDNSGLQVGLTEDSKMQIYFVAPNTPGAKAGFKADDIIQSVNGIDVGYLGGIVALKNLLKEKPGTVLTFEIARGGKTQKLKLILHELYS
ncbi:MAG: aspartyl protease family protein [candidate division Zixibacteria bacterium]|nr:aspartyl protease family protein [candidate division Zixibacteria bacterium]